MGISIHSILPGGTQPDRPQGPGARAERSQSPPAGHPSSPGDAGPVGEDPGATPPTSLQVDPKLWAILTGEERAFYVKHAMSGPLTYGPGSGGTSNTHGRRVGGRIDVRG